MTSFARASRLNGDSCSIGASVAALGEDGVGGVRCGDVPAAVIAELWCVNARKKMFSRAKQSRRNSEVHLVDQACLKILLDRGDTAAEPDILTIGRVHGALKGGVDAIGNEVEGGAAFHGDRCAWVVGEDEHRGVVGRVFAPPSFPIIVWPRAPDGSEHIPSQNPGADIVEAACQELVVNSGGPSILAKHFLKGTGGEGPMV